MNKNLHDIDEIFNAAYRKFEDEPTPHVWQKINEGLAKKEADSYKKRFVIWKRVALFLSLLVAGFTLYESRVLRNGGRQRVERTAGNERVTSLVRMQESIPQNAVVMNDKNTDLRAIAQYKNEPVFKQTNRWNKMALQKNISTGNRPRLQAEIVKTGNPIIQLTDDKSRFINSNDFLPEEKKHSLTAITTITISKTAEQLTGSIKQLPSDVANAPLSKSRVDKNRKINLFRPFWVIAPFASYERAGYRLDSDVPINIVNIKHREAPEPSFSAGIFITRQFAKQWALETGFMYSHTQIGISPQKMYALQNGNDVAYKYITSSGYAYIKPGFGAPPSVGDSLSAAEAKHSLQYVSIPAIINYTVAKKRLSFIPGAGIAANFLTGAKVETEIQNVSNLETVTITKLKAIKSFYWSLIADAEVQYSINRKVSVSLRPSYKQAISPITKDNEVETFPKSFGVGLGVKIKLR